MKAAVFACVFMFVVTAYADELKCQHVQLQIPKDWIDMVDPCIKQMKNQVQEELNASLKYLAMGAHFSKDNINRPGFAKFFFESASEERQHAIKLISYLLMRGELTTELSKLIKCTNAPDKTEWVSGVDALKDALKLEATVTRLIRNVIKECEDPTVEKNGLGYNDYHLVDYLTGEFLEEQYKGQREIAGKISTLEKMMENHGALGEFLYDKKLLE